MAAVDKLAFTTTEILGAPKRSRDYRPERMKQDENPLDRLLSWSHHRENQKIAKLLCEKYGFPITIMDDGAIRSDFVFDGVLSPESWSALGATSLAILLIGKPLKPLSLVSIRMTHLRDPCFVMDKLALDLCDNPTKVVQAEMQNGHQGGFMRPLQNGSISAKDDVFLVLDLAAVKEIMQV